MSHIGFWRIKANQCILSTCSAPGDISFACLHGNFTSFFFSFLFLFRTEFTFSQKDTGLNLQASGTRCALNINTMEINTHRHKVVMSLLGMWDAQTGEWSIRTGRRRVAAASLGVVGFVHRGPAIAPLMWSCYKLSVSSCLPTPHCFDTQSSAVQCGGGSQRVNRLNIHLMRNKKKAPLFNSMSEPNKNASHTFPQSRSWQLTS